MGNSIDRSVGRRLLAILLFVVLSQPTVYNSLILTYTRAINQCTDDLAVKLIKPNPRPRDTRKILLLSAYLVVSHPQTSAIESHSSDLSHPLTDPTLDSLPEACVAPRPHPTRQQKPSRTPNPHHKTRPKHILHISNTQHSDIVNHQLTYQSPAYLSNDQIQVVPRHRQQRKAKAHRYLGMMIESREQRWWGNGTKVQYSLLE